MGALAGLRNSSGARLSRDFLPLETAISCHLPALSHLSDNARNDREKPSRHRSLGNSVLALLPVLRKYSGIMIFLRYDYALALDPTPGLVRRAIMFFCMIRIVVKCSNSKNIKKIQAANRPGREAISFICNRPIRGVSRPRLSADRKFTG